MAGYSGTPLIKKLGIKAGMRVVALNAPTDFSETLGMLPDGVEIIGKFESGHEVMVIFFTTDRDVLEAEFGKLKAALATSGALWISWPKKASGVQTNLNENMVREIGLKNGLVDVKICAVDNIWSGLKFVYRLVDRV